MAMTKYLAKEIKLINNANPSGLIANLLWLRRDDTFF